MKQSKHIAPWEFRSLTPAKLAQFYRLVGGNYDALFIDSPPASLSFIYKSLGCYHSLQQEKDPFVAPYIPALTPQGFVRWQTVQVLLCPEEHVPYLQKAVKSFEILNNGPGGPFPKFLPTDCLPRTSDVELTKWHERVGERLKIESESQRTPRPAGRPPDLESLTDSVEGRAAADSADYFSPVSPRRPGFPNVVQVSPPQRRPQLGADATPGPHFRRHSSNDTRSPDYADGPTPTVNRPYPRRANFRFQRASVESASASSSSPSSPSLSPPRNRHPPKIANPGNADRSPRSYSVARNPYSSGSTSPLRDELGRRHSSHLLNDGRRDSLPQGATLRGPATLSPQFYAAHNGAQGRPISQPGPSPTGLNGPPPPPPPAQSAPAAQGSFARGNLRNTVTHGSRDSSWRNKLSAYVNMTGSNKGHNGVEARDRDRDRDRTRDRESVMEGVRFVDGVDEYDRDRDRRRNYPEREWESEREGRRRERRERRRSGGSGGSTSYERR